MTDDLDRFVADLTIIHEGEGDREAPQRTDDTDAVAIPE
jgi:hypothetical protein